MENIIIIGVILLLVLYLAVSAAIRNKKVNVEEEPEQCVSGFTVSSTEDSKEDTTSKVENPIPLLAPQEEPEKSVESQELTEEVSTPEVKVAEEKKPSPKRKRKPKAKKDGSETAAGSPDDTEESKGTH